MNSLQGGSFACCCVLAAEMAALFGDLHDKVEAVTTGGQASQC